ncbi:MAG: PAS domain-containing protein [Promethearchaeati archaeon]
MKSDNSIFSNTFYKNIIDSLDIPILIIKKIDNQFLIIDCNLASVEIFERNKGDLFDLDIIELYKNEKIIEDLKECFNKKTQFSKLRKLQYLESKEPKIQIIKYHYIESNMAFLYFQSIEKCFGDTKNNKMQEKYVLENLIEHIVFQDNNHTILWANEAAIKSINADLSDLVGKKCYEVWANRSTPCENCPVEAAIKSGKSEIGQQSTYDGRGWYIKGFPVKDTYNNIIGAIEYTIDITEWSNLEKELLNKTRLMHKITETSPVAITLLNLEGNIIFSNKRAKEIFGLKREEMLSRKYNSKEWQIHDLDGNPFPDEELPFRKVIERKKPYYGIKHRITNSDGDMKYLSINAAPLFGENKELINIVTSIEDITEQKKTEQKLIESEKKYREAYSQINLYKDIFAHDINNILQNISTSIELLDIYSNESYVSDNFNEIIKIIEKQVMRGANLNSNINVLSQLENKIESLKPINALTYLRKSVNKIKDHMKYDKNIEIEIKRLPVGNDVYIRANSLIEYLFDNILLNSILHNKNDLITIEINIARKEIEDSDYLTIEFIDNGVGFIDDFKKEIFRNSKEYKRLEGIGLGFMLIKKIIETYVGKIEIENRNADDPSQGSRFLLVLPAANI